MIPFSPPRIDEKTIEAVTQVLRSGWITTGPVTRELEKQLSGYTGAGATLCLNSWTNAAELALRWLGVGPGDEVIVPAYTYAATANIVIHLGARPVLVDSSMEDFNIRAEDIAKKITPATKAIMPVDVGGLPCDYERIMAVAMDHRHTFQAKGAAQERLGRMLILSDSAHSFGAHYDGKKCGHQCDIHGFSFHAVKNLTTAEGGALTFNFEDKEFNEEIRNRLAISALHGQTRDALSKSKAGDWKYDIIEAGYKCNMTDIQAAIGLVELGRYDVETLPRRKAICEAYHRLLSPHEWYIPPIFKTGKSESSYHLFMLRISGFSEEQRDELIRKMAEKQIATNVHFQPLPLLSFYKQSGFEISDYPNAYRHYSHEISLPVYYDLKDEQVETVVETLSGFVEQMKRGQ